MNRHAARSLLLMQIAMKVPIHGNDGGSQNLNGCNCI